MTRSMRLLAASSAVLLIATGVAIAQQLTVEINRISDTGVGEKIGTVVVSEGKAASRSKLLLRVCPKGSAAFTCMRKATAARR